MHFDDAKQRIAVEVTLAACEVMLDAFRYEIGRSFVFLHEVEKDKPNELNILKVGLLKLDFFLSAKLSCIRKLR